MNKRWLIVAAMAAILATMSAAQAPARRTPLIVDDDGSFDGTIGMLYLYYDPAFETKAWTVSPGEAHPSAFANNLGVLQLQLGIEGVPFAAGPEKPTKGKNEFPKEWRANSDYFWYIPLPLEGRAADRRPAARLMVDTIKASSEPVAIVVTGPFTNLALALKMDPSIKSRIKVVEAMGGAIDVEGNLGSDAPGVSNKAAEWNIWVDPEAAAFVFDSGVPVRLVPLDATDRVTWSSGEAYDLAQIDHPGAKMIVSIFRKQLQSFGAMSIPIWDLAAAIDLAHPELSGSESAHLHVITKPGPDQGRTYRANDGPANVSICRSPVEAAYREALIRQFAR